MIKLAREAGGIARELGVAAAHARHPDLRKGAIRTGGVYIAVLGSGMLVTLIGLTALAAVRIQRITVTTAAEAEQARIYAQSAVELGAEWVRADPLWRATRTSGVWAQDQPIGDATFTLEGIDPVDGNLLNRPTDPLILKATITRGRARQIVQARLDASGDPLDVLETAIYVPGELRVQTGATLSILGAPAATGTTLRNDGSIVGDAECLTPTGSGTISGSLTVGALPRTLPTSDVLAIYTGLGTEINPGTLIEKRLLAPGVNPWGATNAEGVYIIRSTQDLVIRDSRIHGTLVILCPGKEVTIAGNVLIHPARADYPSVIVDGDLVLEFSSATELSESNLKVNFNPPAAPYEGTSNNNNNQDSFPSEIRGLVHVTGDLAVRAGSPRLRGTAIVESAASSSAIEIGASLEIIHDPQIMANPPMGYMEAVSMSVTPGSWRQVVLP